MVICQLYKRSLITFLLFTAMQCLLTGSLQGQISFSNVAGLGADASDIGFNKDGGCSFADFDLDGDLDLVVNTSDNNAARRSFLLRNDNGVFTDVTAAVAPGLQTSGITDRSVAWGDCNNDGYPDLIVNTFSRYKILINSAGTSFSLHTNATTITDGINTEGLGWFDYDNDGDLDYFVENDEFGVDVFQNDGSTPNPVFTQVTIDATGAAGTGAGGLGLPEGGSSDGDYATSVDLNNDGYVDIIARRRNNGTNDGQDNNPYDIFLNDGDGTFTPLTTFNEFGNNSDKGAILSGDFDNDGDFDILWTSGTTDGNRAALYENTGSNSMNFVLVANPFLLDGGAAFSVTNTEGAAMGDIDLDGDLDIFMTVTGGGTHYLFLNNSSGPGNFSFRQPGPTSVPGAAINYGINIAANGQGCVFVDYDNDGDVDLYVNRNGAANQLWRNDYVGSAAEASATYQENYLRIIPMVDLAPGVQRPAVNATVTFLDCVGDPIGGVREIGSGGAGHGSQTSPWLIFGLKNGPDEPYRIEVKYTRDGTIPVTVTKTIVPNTLPEINMGSSNLLMSHTIVIRDTDSDDSYHCQDTDGDGINDYTDLDNDNDGIPDTEEGCGNLVQNSSFEKQDFADPAQWPDGLVEPAGTFIGATFNSNELEGWSYDANLDGWVGGESPSWSSDVFSNAFHGAQFIDVMGGNTYTGVNNTLTTSVPTTIGEEYQFSFYWGEDVGHPVSSQVTLDVSVEDADAVVILAETLLATASGPAAGVRGPKTWYFYQTSFIATTSSTTLKFQATPPSGSTAAGAALDLVKVTALDCGDTDGDGIDDYLDLDSDNDGIYDLVEAGHGATDANNDGIIDGAPVAFGSNGLFDAIEDSADSGVLDQPTADSDNDDIPNSAEIDSDNDGCLDSIEAGFTDTDEDGEVDGSGYAADGTVTGSDGYTGTDPIVTDFNQVAPSCDTDGDGINPTVDLDDDNDGLLDTEEKDCSGFSPLDLSTSTNLANSTILDEATSSVDFSTLFSAAITSNHTSAEPSRPEGLVNGDIRLYQNSNSDVSEYRIDFDFPTTVRISQAGINGAFEQAETWTITTEGGTMQVYNPVINVTTSNGSTWNDNELQDVTGDMSNTVSFRPKTTVADGNIAVPDSDWSITAEEAGSITIQVKTISPGNNACRVRVSTDCVPIDTDSDGIPDHLDTDSDGDDCLDTIEAGFTDTDADGEVDGSGYAADGTVTGSDGYTGTDPIVTDFNQVAPSCDTDGDGINPTVDLDDDNDGIPDSIEGLCTPSTFTDAYADVVIYYEGQSILAAYASDPTQALGPPDYDSSVTPNPRKYVSMGSAPRQLILGFSDNVISNSGDASTDVQVTEVGPAVESTILSLLPTLDTKTLLDNQGIISPDADGYYLIGTVAGAIESLDIDAVTNDAFYGGQLQFTALKLVSNVNSSGATAGPDIDSVEGLYSSCASRDTDRDGVPDYLDLDSDNDGIYDLVEAGHEVDDLDSNGVIDGAPTDFGDNGLFDGVEDAPDSGILDQPTADSDSDGQIDSVEIDSDNDGCNDVIEAGYDDPDGNGLLGNGN